MVWVLNLIFSSKLFFYLVDSVLFFLNLTCHSHVQIRGRSCLAPFACLLLCKFAFERSVNIEWGSVIKNLAHFSANVHQLADILLRLDKRHR